MIKQTGANAMKVSNETLKSVDIIIYVVYLKNTEVPIVGGVFGEHLSNAQVAYLAMQIEKLTQDNIEEIAICRS